VAILGDMNTMLDDDRAVPARPRLKGFVLKLLNTTVVDFVAAVLHSSKLLCLPAGFCRGIHMDLLARLGVVGKPLELADLRATPARD